MMNYLTLFAIIAASAVSSAAATRDAGKGRHGYRLNERVRGARLLSEVGADADGLRRWREDDYEAVMTVMSGGRLLRGRGLQQDGDGGRGAYYRKEQPPVARWQKIALGITVSACALLACYVCALRKELSTLNQYLPLGYKLFPDAPEEEGRASGGGEADATGVEMK